MGNAESDICRTLNICGNDSGPNEQEINTELIGHNNQNGAFNQYQDQQQYNNNGYYQNDINNLNQYNNGYPPSPYNNNYNNQSPISSNVPINTAGYRPNTTPQYNQNSAPSQAPKQYVEEKQVPISSNGYSNASKPTARYTLDVNENVNNISKSAPTQNGATPKHYRQESASKAKPKSRPIATQARIDPNAGFYDKINAIITNPVYKGGNNQIINQIKSKCNDYSRSMLTAKIQEIMNQNKNTANIGYPICSFPAPFYMKNKQTPNITISCCNSEKSDIYKLPAIDEYFGDLCDIHKYDKYNNNNFNKSLNKFKNEQQCQSFVHHSIYKPLYESNGITKYKFNQWSTININKVYLPSSKNIKDINDRWLTLIAFSGFAAHRTIACVYKNDDNVNPNRIYQNDCTILSEYDVRDGYTRYGARAYFDGSYACTAIFISADKKVYTPNSGSKEWERAKWIWKVCNIVVCQ